MFKNIVKSSMRYYSTPKDVAYNAIVKLNRSLIAVSGEETHEFLNGTTPIKVPPPPTINTQLSDGIYTVLMNAKGRVCTDLYVYPLHPDSPLRSQIKSPTSEAYILEVNGDLTPTIMKILNTFAMTSTVNIQQLFGFNVYGLWDDLEDVSFNNVNAELYSKDSRAAGFGYRLISSSPNLKIGLPQLSTLDYDLRRYLFGLPEGNDYIYDKSLPLEFSVDYMNGIDFLKGCYLGQELTCRMHMHNTVRKRVRPVVLKPSKNAIVPENLYEPQVFNIPANSDIIDERPSTLSDTSSPFGNSGSVGRRRPAGTLIGSIGNVGLAMLRADVEGHVFRVGSNYVHPITPFWWPGA